MLPLRVPQALIWGARDDQVPLALAERYTRAAREADDLVRLVVDTAAGHFETASPLTGGIGKPEHLKYFGRNVWSRCISEADRLVYEIFGDRSGDVTGQKDGARGCTMAGEIWRLVATLR